MSFLLPEEPHRSLNMNKPADVNRHFNSFRQKKKEAKKEAYI